MKITKEITLRDFEPWAGGIWCYKRLTEDELDQLEAELEALYPDGIDEAELNDLFWFDDDWIFRLAGHVENEDEDTEEDEHEDTEEDEDNDEH